MAADAAGRCGSHEGRRVSQGNDEEHTLCPAEEIPVNGVRVFPLGRHGIGVFNIEGRFYALSNRCPHAGAPVCHGTITGTTRYRGGYDMDWVREGEILQCPWHAWQFEIATGRSLTRPAWAVKTYPVWVENGYLVVRLTSSGRPATEESV
ncbi:MAG: Rieske 2Fe-2S domain-containing protein [Streptosporangiales bacterium]|nr:Rieske 2Fe-2S domain-containing protein [Streptosporangiales bacterium]